MAAMGSRRSYQEQAPQPCSTPPPPPPAVPPPRRRTAAPARQPGGSTASGEGSGAPGLRRAAHRLTERAGRARYPGRPRRVRAACRARALASSGDVVSLLAHLPRPSRIACTPAAVGLLARPRRSRSASPVWPVSRWRSSSSRPSTPRGVSPSATPSRWPAGCGCWPRAVSCGSPPAPWCSLRSCSPWPWAGDWRSAGRGLVRLRAPITACDALRVGRGASPACTSCSPCCSHSCSMPPRPAVGHPPDDGRRRGPGRGRRRLGRGRESGLLDGAFDRGPTRGTVLRGVLAGLMTALALCAAVVAVALVSDARGYATLSGYLGGAGAGAVGLVGPGAAPAAQRGRRGARARGRPRVLRGFGHARLGARGDARRRCRPSRCWRRCRTPGGALDRLRLAGGSRAWPGSSREPRWAAGWVPTTADRWSPA